MKSISEYIIDSQFENYLFNNLRTLLYFDEDLIEESLELFANYKIILDICLKDIQKLSKDFKEQQIKVSINSVQEYPKNIFLLNC